MRVAFFLPLFPRERLKSTFAVHRFLARIDFTNSASEKDSGQHQMVAIFDDQHIGRFSRLIAPRPRYFV
jgi:hypothetical protein